MQYPNYDTTADIEVINGNIKKLVQNAEEQDAQIKSKEPIINKKTGFNLDKTDLTENESNKLFSAKGALNLFNTLTTNFTDAINIAKEALRVDIARKFDKDGGEITNNIILNQDKAIRIKKEGSDSWGEYAIGYVSSANTFYTGLLSSNYMVYSNANPKLKIGNSQYTYYHTGNKPTAEELGVEPAITNKRSGFNLDKTDLTENDTNKLFSALGALNLKNWVVENYTTLMNNIRENLTTLINNKVSKNGDEMSGTLSLPRISVSDRIVTDTFSWGGRGAQVMDIGLDRIILGNMSLSNLCLQVSSSSGAKVMVDSEFFTLYHTGYKPSKTDVGLSKVDNTSDVEKSVLSATKLKTARGITIGSSTKQFDGQSNITYSLSEIGALPANGDRDILISSNRAIRVIPAEGEASVYGIGYTSADETFNVGIASKKLKLWCNGNPQVKINGTDRDLYHTGNLNIQNTIKNQIVSKISVSQNTKTVIYTSPTLTGFSDTDIFYVVLDENGGGETKVFTIPFGILRNLASRQSEGSSTGLFATTYALETSHIVRFFIDTDGALKGQCLTSGWHLLAAGVVGGSFAG